MVRKLVPLLPAIVAFLALGAVSLTSLPELSTSAKAIGIGCATASMLAAVFVPRVELRAHASVALAAGAMVAAGQVGHDPVFMASGVPFLAAAVVALRSPRLPEALVRRRAASGPSAWERLVPVRTRGPMVLALATAAITSILLVVAIPPASRVVESQVDRFFTGQIEVDQRIGFSARLKLGSTTKMLASDRVVFRVEGTAPELLRGGVYDRYEGEIWSGSRETERTQIAAPSPSRVTARILLARTARLPRGVQARFFVPPGTCRFGTPSGKVQFDGFGLLRPVVRDDLYEILVEGRQDAMESGDGCATSLLSPPPGEEDLGMPAALQKQLAPIALEWLGGREDLSPAATMDVFARRLRGFGYSLSVKRNHRIDPVIDLLTEHREGHCEMFASALALLARTRGIPARVVTGYRVSETNPLTGASVVRERNAHAWVEAWLDGAWTTVDPTPAAEMAAKPKASWLDDVGDAIGTEIDRAWAAALRADPVSLGMGFVALGVAFLAVRRGLAAWRRRRPRIATEMPRALSSYDDLENALRRAGLRRKASEPLERFAQRVEGGSEGWAADVGLAIRRYAKLRYGGAGTEREVAAELEAVARRVGDGPATAS